MQQKNLGEKLINLGLTHDLFGGILCQSVGVTSTAGIAATAAHQSQYAFHSHLLIIKRLQRDETFYL